MLFPECIGPIKTLCNALVDPIGKKGLVKPINVHINVAGIYMISTVQRNSGLATRDSSTCHAVTSKQFTVEPFRPLQLDFLFVIDLF